MGIDFETGMSTTEKAGDLAVDKKSLEKGVFVHINKEMEILDDSAIIEQLKIEEAESLEKVRQKIANIGNELSLGQEAVGEKEKLLEFRFKQSSASRLAEYITGIRPDDPRMAERLIEDQKIIRAKYNLPDRIMRAYSSAEYERILKEMARGSSTNIRDKSECSKFFEKYPIAGAVHMGDEKSVFIGIDRANQKSYLRGLGVLEHELIHAEQEKRYKNMPIELKEYEAYVADLNPDFIKSNSGEIEFLIFDFFVAGSVNAWYKQLNEKAKERSYPEVRPVWEDPEFFLKNIDNINQDDIDNYKRSNNITSEI